jgi:hypothetical protein
MWYVLLWLLVILLLLAALGAAAFVAWCSYSGISPRDVLFGPRPEPRLSIIEQAHLDGRRRLVLIRRDDVEHLIMTGGPVDVVIEDGIRATPRSAPAPAESSENITTVFPRTPRIVGQGGGEQ